MTDPTAAIGADALHFESPDGKTWERDTDHQAGPRAPMMRPIFEETFSAGTAVAFRRIGAPLSHGETCHVHGWSYLRMVPAGVPDKPGPSKTPPAPVLKVLTRLVPELRRRERTARVAIADERWMDDVRAWWDERPEWERRFRAHQSRDLASLDGAELAGAVADAARDGLAMLTRHFELITPAAGIGLALVTATEHGLAPVAVAEALRGSSRSTAAPSALVASISHALDEARANSVTSLDEARAASPEAARLIDDHLDTYGWRILADDLDAPTLAESPEVLLRAVQRAGDDVDTTEARPISDLLDRVPADKRAEFERLLTNAGASYEMLDDNSSFACWGLGVLRRTLLEAGRRLVASGVLHDPGQLWLLEIDEVTEALRGTGHLRSDAVGNRQRVFEAQKRVDGPQVLGGPVEPPPDAAVFPRGLRAITEAVGLYLSLRFPPPDERADTGRVERDGRVVASGHGIGSGAATGRAVVATSAHDALDRLQPGDVLVCPVTNPAYNIVFPIAAAVVTAAGGPFGHTAVTAREVGIPAVVGIGDLSAIADGDQVVVLADR